MNTSDKIRPEFDEAALLQAEKQSEIITSLRLKLFEALPPGLNEALEIGCGLGGFARLLARKAKHVLALDLSPEMIRIARARSEEHPNIEYQVADVITWDFPVERFDCAVSMMTLHYLPLEETLVKMGRSLRPGGTLMVVDFYELSEWDRALQGIWWRVRRKFKKLFSGRRGSKDLRPWRNDPQAAFLSVMKNYPMDELRGIYQRALPGARVMKHSTLRRYSAVWTKPEKSQG